MKKQIRFVMDNHDENEFFNFIKKNKIVFFIKCNQNPESIIELS